MRRPGRLVSMFGAVAAVVLAQVLISVPAAVAHTHPTPVELDSPAVVFVRTWAQVDISLVEHNAVGKHIPLTQRSYRPLLAEGSGFAVDPTGSIVTSADLVTPDLRRAEIYAVNSIFHDRYGDAVPLPADPFAEQTIANLPNDLTNTRLQRCYQPNETNDTGGCVVASSLQFRVYPYVTSQDEFGALPAELVKPPGGQTSDVAVLKVGASSMPTVDLGKSLAGTKAVAALGFTGIPAVESPLKLRLAHFTAEASGIPNQTGEDDTKGIYRKLVAGLGNGMAGGPVVGEQGQVVGFFPAPQGGATPKIVDAGAIRKALTDAQVTPERGPTDQAFENAMHSFKNDEYAGSIPGFDSTLELYPGHFDANRNRAVADAKKGTPADLTPQGQASGTQNEPSGGSDTGWVIAGISGIVLLLLGALAVLLLFRRRELAPQAGGAAPAPAGTRSASRVSGVTPTPRRAGDASRPSRAPTGAAPGQHAAPAQRSAPKAGSPSAAGQPPAAPAPRGAPSGASAPGSAPAPASGPATGGRAPAPGGLSVMSQPKGSGTGPGPAAPSAQGFCTNCGQRLAPNHRFCGWCGHHVE